MSKKPVLFLCWARIFGSKPEAERALAVASELEDFAGGEVAERPEIPTAGLCEARAFFLVNEPEKLSPALPGDMRPVMIPPALFPLYGIPEEPEEGEAPPSELQEAARRLLDAVISSGGASANLLTDKVASTIAPLALVAGEGEEGYRMREIREALSIRNIRPLGSERTVRIEGLPPVTKKAFAALSQVVKLAGEVSSLGERGSELRAAVDSISPAVGSAMRDLLVAATVLFSDEDRKALAPLAVGKGEAN